MAKLPCLGWNPNQPLHDDNTMSLLTANTWQFPNAFARRHNDSIWRLWLQHKYYTWHPKGKHYA